MTRPAVALVAALTVAAAALAGERPKPAAVGDKVAAADQLRDVRGGRRPLAGFAGHKAVVLAFLGADCPVSNLYLPGPDRAGEAVPGRRTCCSWPSTRTSRTTPTRSAGHAADRDVPFLVLKDYGQKLADAVGVTRVPSVAVLDGDFELKYRGRVDDQYGVAAQAAEGDPRRPGRGARRGRRRQAGHRRRRPRPTAARWRETDKPAARPGSRSQGRRPDPAEALRGLPPRRPVGPVHPVELRRRRQARGRPIKEVTAQRRMPPWHADTRFGHFTNDRRLSRAEIDTLAAWVDGGKPRGDDKDLPKPIAVDQGLGPRQAGPGVHDARGVRGAGRRRAAVQELDHRHEVHRGQVGDDRPRPGPGAGRGPPRRRVHPAGREQRTRSARTGTSASWSAGHRATWASSARRTRPCACPRGRSSGWRCTTRPTARRRRTARRSASSSPSKPPKYELFLNEFANMGVRDPAGGPAPQGRGDVPPAGRRPADQP